MTTITSSFFPAASALFLPLLLLASTSLSSAWAGSAFGNRGATIPLARPDCLGRAHPTHNRRIDRIAFPMASSSASSSPSFPSLPLMLFIRGGQQADGDTVASDETAGLDSPETRRRGYGAPDESGGASLEMTSPAADVEGAGATADVVPVPPRIASLAPVASVAALLKSAGAFYTRQLTARPVTTKSLTAGVIFGLSDWCAQLVEGRGEDDEDGGTPVVFSRVLTAFLVGVLFFGPAANAWYETIFKVLPSTSLVSTLQKAALGQIIFGPTFTCVFFGAGMVQSGTFTPGAWVRKIREDLPGVWASGLGYWPLVDFVSYKVVPVKWIPLFVNFCSFVWTIYLSLVSNRAEGEEVATG